MTTRHKYRYTKGSDGITLLLLLTNCEDKNYEVFILSVMVLLPNRAGDQHEVV